MSIGLGIGNSIGGKISGFGGGTQFLLDSYGGAAAAYSVRKLSSTATLSMRVRRSSDNEEQDIGFVSGDLDTATMLSFVGANDGFVVTWYDQSGNSNNMSQAASANQPIIVSSGTLVTDNGKPALRNPAGDTRQMGAPSTLPSTGDAVISMFTVINAESVVNTTQNAFFTIAPAVSATDRRFVQHTVESSTQLAVRLQGGNSVFGSITNADNQILYTTIKPAVSVDFDGWKNGESLALTGSGTEALNLQSNSAYKVFSGGAVAYGTNSISSSVGNGTVQEGIYYFTDQTANRTAIESNINTYYAVYTP